MAEFEDQDREAQLAAMDVSLDYLHRNLIWPHTFVAS